MAKTTLIGGLLFILLGLNEIIVFGESANQPDLKKMENLYQTATEAYQKGNIKESETAVLELLRMNPKQTSGLYLWGLILVQKREVDQALATFKKIIEIEPSFYFAYYQAGLAYEGKGEVEEAVKIYNTGLNLAAKDQQHPDAKSVVENINRRLFDIGDTPEKAKEIRALFEEGQQAYHLGKLKDALTAYLSMNKLAPHSRGTLLFLGIIMEGMGESAQAARYYHKTLDEDPNFTAAHLFLGILYEGQGQLDEAIGEYVAAAATAQKSLEGIEAQKRLLKIKETMANESSRFNSPGYREAKPFFSEGLADLGAGKYAEAAASFQKATELDSQNPYAFLNFGMANVRLNEYRPAIAAFKKSLLLKPDYALAYFWLAVMFEISGDTAQKAGGVKEAIDEYINAEINYRQAVRYGGKEWEVEASFAKLQVLTPRIEKMEVGAGYFVVGNELFSKNQYEPAVKLLEKAAELFPFNPLPYHNIGFIYYKMGKDDKAEEFYKKSLERSTEIGDSYYQLGLIYEKKQAFDKAQEMYQKAVDTDPLESDYHFRLGLAWDQKGNLTKALENYEAVLTYAKDKPNRQEIYNSAQVRIAQIKKAINPLSITFSDEFLTYDSNINASLTNKQGDFYNTVSGNLYYLLLQDPKWTVPLTGAASVVDYVRSQVIILTLSQGFSPAYRTGRYNLNPGINFTYSHTGTGPSSLGVSLSLTSSVSNLVPNSSLSATVTYDLAHSYLNSNFDAARENFNITATKAVGERTSVGFTYTYFINQVVADEFSYRSNAVGISVSRLFTELFTATISGSYATSRHQQVYHIDSLGNIVDDSQLFYLVETGFEMSYIFKPKWTFTCHFEYQKNSSNFDIPVTSTGATATSLLTGQTTPVGGYDKYILGFKVSRVF